MKQGMDTMLAHYIQSNQQETASLLAKGKKGEEIDASTAAQFMQLFNSSVVKDFEHGVANVKGSSGLSFAGVFNNRAKAAQDSGNVELNTAPRKEIVQPEQRADTSESRRSRQPVNQKPEARTEADSRRGNEVDNRSESGTDKSRKAEAQKPEPAENKAKGADAPGRLVSEAAADKPSESEAAERVQNAVRKAMFSRHGEQKVEPAKATADESMATQKQSRLLAAITSADTRQGAKAASSSATQSFSLAGEGKAGVEASQPGAQNGAQNQQSQSNNGQAQQMISLQAVKPDSATSAKTGNQFTSTMKGVMANTAKASGQAQQVSQPQAAAGSQHSGKAQASAPMTDTEKLVRSRQAEIVKQIVRSARLMTKGDGTQELKLILKPESLGWLKMNVSMQGQKMTALITAENDSVRTMLEQNIHQLQTSLQNQNIRVHQIVIQVSGEQQATMNMNDQDGELLKEQHDETKKHHSSTGTSQEELQEEIQNNASDLVTAQQANLLAGVDMRI